MSPSKGNPIAQARVDVVVIEALDEIVEARGYESRSELLGEYIAEGLQREFDDRPTERALSTVKLEQAIAWLTGAQLEPEA